MNVADFLYNPDKVNKAYDFAVKDFSRDEIFNLLKSGDDIKIQIGLINLEEIQSTEEAEFLLTFLTNNPGPVREICSEKVKEFFCNEQTRKYFSTKTCDILIKGLCDVIPAVAGNTAKILFLVPESQKTFDKLISSAFEKIERFEKETDLHEKNRLKFALYRILEALYYFDGDVSDDFKRLLEICSDDPNYTIREKIAKTVTKRPEFEELKNKLSQDECFYVHKFFV